MFRIRNILQFECDHKWIPERNIFDTINSAVDSIFTNFLSRPNIRQPILTQYCDGQRVTCPGLMTKKFYTKLENL